MSDILFEVTGDGVAVVTLNNPRRKNAVSIAAAKELHVLWATVQERADIKVLVIAAADCGVWGLSSRAHTGQIVRPTRAQSRRR